MILKKKQHAVVAVEVGWAIIRILPYFMHLSCCLFAQALQLPQCQVQVCPEGRAENASASSCSAHTAEARKQEVGIQSLPEAAFLTLLEAHNGSLQGTRVLFSLMAVTPTKPSLITSIKYVFNDILPLLSLSLPHSPALSASGSHRLCMTSSLLQTGRWKGERR